MGTKRQVAAAEFPRCEVFPWRREDSATGPALSRAQARQLLQLLELVLDQFWAGEHRASDGLEIACRLRALQRRIDLSSSWDLELWLDLRRRLLELVADLGDAHTVLELPRSLSVGATDAARPSPLAAVWRLPFDLVERDAGVVIESCAGWGEEGSLRPGTRVLAWNGRPISEVVERAGQWLPLPWGHPHRRREALRWLTRRPLLRVPDLPARSVDLVVEPPGRTPTEIRLAWLPAESAVGSRRTAVGWPAGSDEQATTNGARGSAEWCHWRVRRVDGLGWLCLGAVPATDEVPRLAREMADLGSTPGWVVDLRGNRGGELAAVESLVRLLTGRERAQIGVEHPTTPLAQRLCGAALPVTGVGAERDPGRRGTVSGIGDFTRHPCWVLMDASTYSAALVLAAALRRAGAVVVASERVVTGGSENAWGYETLRQLLPNRRERVPRSRVAEVVRQEAARRGGRAVQLHPLRWWIGDTGRASTCAIEVAEIAPPVARAAGRPSGATGLRGTGVPAADGGVVELRWFERDRPILPDLPRGVSLQLPVRRTRVALDGPAEPNAASGPDGEHADGFSVRSALAPDAQLPAELRGASARQICHWLWSERAGRTAGNRTDRHAWCRSLDDNTATPHECSCTTSSVNTRREVPWNPTTTTS